ncbi:protein MANNAN SYNTHESIS-RELATED 2-like [Dioscorea cayenensis subsp. rotundata]|uniref:O-fucosyltransferase family protein n=1 Tax=Dioscorea cayennensis subsp. rotundata TaxID=55577 RepID=A0AB40BS96_DIOCR|nr:protein MANNAN SYNTHESIS-RELATED 2-like [Dioscorea cayenensis subsp. rotundata]XP_039130221.1 protein MANNAN SYNTHESIS-RELATED 2-like [Dioscorea cayenensis subsp. rotundata]
MDPRHILAGILTLAMFAMLGNMIKKDHFDSFDDGIRSDVHFNVLKVESELQSKINGPWEEMKQELKPCWKPPSLKAGAESNGYITLSLKSGPEFHMPQIAVAVVIARHLGATLVLPDIRSGELGQKRDFKEYYDLDKFYSSLWGVVDITREIPADVASENPTVVKVPNQVSEDFLVKNIEPIFEKNRYLRLAISYPSTNMKLEMKQNDDIESTTCLAMFSSLELKQEIREVVDQVVENLRALSNRSDGKFIAVDLKVELLEKKACQEVGASGRKNCYNGYEIGQFLKKIGFDTETTIYITQTWWHENAKALKDIFPRTYTKDDVLPDDQKTKFLRSQNVELEKLLDFEVCSQSDVFVPSMPGMFYGSVTGRRIGSGRTQILIPANFLASYGQASDHVSAYVSEKKHLAYSCFC